MKRVRKFLNVGLMVSALLLSDSSRACAELAGTYQASDGDPLEVTMENCKRVAMKFKHSCVVMTTDVDGTPHQSIDDLGNVTRMVADWVAERMVAYSVVSPKGQSDPQEFYLSEVFLGVHHELQIDETHFKSGTTSHTLKVFDRIATEN